MTDMKAEIKDGQLKIDLYELVRTLPDQQLKQIARYVAAQEELFEAVLSYVVNGSFYADEDGSWWFDRSKLLELREKLTPLMPEVAKGALKNVLSQRDEAIKETERFRKWAWSMYRAWPESHWRSRPDLPEWLPTPGPTDEEVEVLMSQGEKL